jgi:3-hydroxy-9,10-secoandrosta-1,3,5(10)-triene-9,17-dione monooxygenase
VQRWASDGTLITVEQNLRLWAMLQQAGRMAATVELLFKNAGTPVARAAMGIPHEMYRVHPSLFENSWAPVGRARLGLPIRHLF